MESTEAYLKSYYAETIEQFSDEKHEQLYVDAVLRLKILSSLSEKNVKQDFMILCLLDIWAMNKDVIGEDACNSTDHESEARQIMWEADDLLRTLDYDTVNGLG